MTAVAAIFERLAGRARPVVLIDGGAGAGKSTLAAELEASWPTGAVELVGLDEAYPGWSGLAEGSALVPQIITAGTFRRWDWQADRPGDQRDLDRGLPLIIEGCGAITPAGRTLADLTVWVEADEAVRRQRALARDGAVFAPYWDSWAAQEEQHWLTDDPRSLADLIIHS